MFKRKCDRNKNEIKQMLTKTNKTNKLMKKIYLIILLVGLLAFSCKGKKSTNQEVKPLSDIAADAFIYGRPLLESYDNIYRFAIDNTNTQYAPLNKLYIIRKPSTPKDTWVVTPNVDTPYMRAWMDLSKDAVVIVVPKIENKRYWVFQLMDVYSNNFAYLGSRTTGWDGGKYLLTGPNWEGNVPEGFEQVKTTTDFCAVLGRIYVKGEDDIPTLNKIQDGFKMMTLSEYNGEEAIPTDTEWLKPVDVKANPLAAYSIINEMIQKNPPVEEEQADVKVFDALGFGADFDLEKISEEQKTALTEGLKIAKERLTKQLSPGAEGVTVKNGWLLPNDFVGNFEREYLGRAAITIQGYMANSPEEAVYYYAAVDAQNKPLNGENNYTIHFDKGQTPNVEFFWSATLYDSKNKLLVENEIDRYAIGDRTEGLKFNDDGSLDIYVQAEKPDADKAANWLPAPKEPFYVILRMYGPSQEILDQQYEIPGFVSNE